MVEVYEFLTGVMPWLAFWLIAAIVAQLSVDELNK